MGSGIKLKLRKNSSVSESTKKRTTLILHARTTVSYLVSSKNEDEDVARKEYIFNVLILGFLLLTFSTFLISLTRYLMQGATEQNVPPGVIAVPVFALLVIYLWSRKKFIKLWVYIFLATFFILSTYSLYLYSFSLPQGLLIYVLLIISAGILISSAAAIAITLFILLSLACLAYVQINQITKPYTVELYDPINVSNLIVYIFIFLVIFLISWLSNKEIERSLRRARKSEKLLRIQNDKLEEKVIERTRELEKAQIEKSQELYRFAEFGRLSSSLLHDLANPITAISLNLQQLESSHKNALVEQAREGIVCMEQYVESARKQLRKKGEVKTFDTKQEIEKVISFLNAKAASQKVKISTNLSRNLQINGDNSKFSQVIANLIGNAIDSYATVKRQKRNIFVESSLDEKTEQICIVVKDNGIGINPKEIIRIYEPFFTTKSSSRGTGIGLTITKSIIEEDFQGSIEVSSSTQTGTAFVVKLPVN